MRLKGFDSTLRMDYNNPSFSRFLNGRIIFLNLINHSVEAEFTSSQTCGISKSKLQVLIYRQEKLYFKERESESYEISFSLSYILAAVSS